MFICESTLYLKSQHFNSLRLSWHYAPALMTSHIVQQLIDRVCFIVKVLIEKYIVTLELWIL